MRFCSFRSADALACDPASETLSAGGKTHVVAETRDAFGRFVGYVYSKNGAAQQTVSASYEAATGRIATASFVHGGAQKTFSYAYLAGTSLVQTLTCPNNMTETRSYEAARNLLSGIAYKRGTTLVSQRTYVRDALGRPLTRSTARNGTTRNDAFGYNARSELTSATLGNDEYAYAFDNIGNRNTASETGSALAYSTNNLNQYASIGENEGNAFVPGYDADGNATSIQTSTGTWSVEYNGANRPVRFRNEESDTTIDCGYDSQGRRCFKKVTVAGTVTLHHRYIYRGYLQIACVDLTRSGHPALWFVTWDPSQPTATRPLAIQKDGTWYTYGCDITKNVCEVFGPAGYIRTSYSYAPFGAATASGDVSQPFQWSSEHYDSELALVYYNFRHYSPDLGRWLSRDPIEEQGGRNLYAYANGNPLCESDWLGQAPKDKRYGLPDEFWRWYHRQVKRPGDKDITKEEADDLYDEWKKSGKPNGEGSKTEKENKMVICPGEPAPSPAAALNWLEVSGLVAIGVSIILVDIVTIPSGEGACGVAIITWALAN